MEGKTAVLPTNRSENRAFSQIVFNFPRETQTMI